MPEVVDKQYTYYTLKLLEVLVYPSRRRRSILNKTLDTRSLLEDLPLAAAFGQLKAESFDFWEVYYRHNNYFLERNSALLGKLKSNKHFEQASFMNDHAFGFENFIEFFDPGQNALSPIGVRVCSLIDIIKIMKSMGLSLLTINTTVKSLAERFKVEQEIIERVFKASEENISFLVHKTGERSPWQRADVFKKLFEYLPCRDGLELVLANKEHYQSLKEAWIGSKLRVCDDLRHKQQLRMSMWYSLVFPVRDSD